MSDENLSLVGGSVKSYSIKNKRQENGKYFVEIEANITDCRKSDDVTNALTGGDRNGLISNPTNLAEKYSNARSLAQRGESDRALKIYEKLLEEKIIYADPILDMVLLAKKVYGSSGAKEYIQKSFSQIKNRPEYFFALELISNEPVDGAWEVILNNSDSFPPLIDAYFNNHENYCIEKFPPQNDKFPEMKFNNCRNEIIKLEKIQSIVSKLEIIKKSGEYGNFFLDPYKAKDYSENMWNSVYLKTLENSVKSLENSVAALKKNEVNLSRANDAMERLNEIKKKQKDVNDAQQTDLKNKYPNLFKD
jgi:exonuclease VII small subunit